MLVIALMRWASSVVGPDLALVRKSRRVTKTNLAEMFWKVLP